MNLLIRLSLGLIGAAVPVLALAAAPQNVTDITAIEEDGKVRVTWTQVSDPDIAAYRIFYSHASILGNSGLYDDFESVDGTVNSHLLQNIPPVNELFVSILAVNGAGEESPFFLEEARVTLGNAPSSAAASSAMTSAMSDDALRLLSAEAISATGIVLRFSHAVSIPAQQAMDAITIEYGSGMKLPLRRFVVDNYVVTVHTFPQEQNRAYRVVIGPMVMGKGQGGEMLGLAADQAPLLFSGHFSGTPPLISSVSSQPAQSSGGNDVLQLRLRAQPDGATTYVVEATWQAPVGQIAGYNVSQTTDGGQTYSQPLVIAKETTAVRIPRVPSGSFGVLIKTVFIDGSMSNGVTQIISLPAMQGGMQGNVTQSPANGGGALPDSGPALWLMVAGLGALSATWTMKNRRKALQEA